MNQTNLNLGLKVNEKKTYIDWEVDGFDAIEGLEYDLSKENKSESPRKSNKTTKNKYEEEGI